MIYWYNWYLGVPVRTHKLADFLQKVLDTILTIDVKIKNTKSKPHASFCKLKVSVFMLFCWQL